MKTGKKSRSWMKLPDMLSTHQEASYPMRSSRITGCWVEYALLEADETTGVYERMKAINEFSLCSLWSL